MSQNVTAYGFKKVRISATKMLDMRFLLLLKKNYCILRFLFILHYCFRLPR